MAPLRSGPTAQCLSSSTGLELEAVAGNWIPAVRAQVMKPVDFLLLCYSIHELREFCLLLSDNGEFLVRVHRGR